MPGDAQNFGVNLDHDGNEVPNQRVVTRYPYASPMSDETRSLSENETQQSMSETGRINEVRERQVHPDHAIEEFRSAQVDDGFGETVSDQLNRMRLIRLRRQQTDSLRPINGPVEWYFK